MALNSDSTNQIFTVQFSDFKRNHDCLSQYANNNISNFEDIFPRELRLFRIRLRISIGLKIAFDKDFAMVKNEPTEKAYVEIMKCNESWFSCEAMNKLCQKWNLKKNSVKSPVDFFDEQTLLLFDVTDIIILFNKQINSSISSSKSFEVDVENYLVFLEKTVTGDSLKKIIRPIIQKIKMQQDWQHKEILAIVYGTRNIFVHQGESAKSGVKYYKNKITLLKFLYDYTILFQLKVVNFAFDKKIKQYGLVI